MSLQAINQEEIKTWLADKFAHKLGCSREDVDENMLFIDFGIDSTEVLLLVGELEDWIEIEMPPTAMWYHPTIAKLSVFIQEELEAQSA